jgi:multiple sugar transport system ATP-binding protein
VADRIVLLRDGQIEQAGAPLDMFERPATQYVAGFLGSPPMNFVPATLVSDGPQCHVRLADGEELALPPQRVAKFASRAAQAVTLGLRPEHISRAGGELRPGLARYAATIDLVQPTGSRTYATFKLGGIEAIAELEAHDVQRANERIELALDMNRAVLIDPVTQQVL